MALRTSKPTAFQSSEGAPNLIFGIVLQRFIVNAPSLRRRFCRKLFTFRATLRFVRFVIGHPSGYSSRWAETSLLSICLVHNRYHIQPMVDRRLTRPHATKGLLCIYVETFLCLGYPCSGKRRHATSDGAGNVDSRYRVRVTTPLGGSILYQRHVCLLGQSSGELRPVALSGFHPDSLVALAACGGLSRAVSACLRTWPFSLIGCSS